MKLGTLTGAIAATTALVAMDIGVPGKAEAHGSHAWTTEEVAVIASLQLSSSDLPLSDPSNAYERSADARELGRALFNDSRLSVDGKVSCASCHAAGSQFTDTLPLGRGVGTGTRRTMPIMGAQGSPFLFWDGRKDSLWSQALGPLEDPREHGGNRTGIAKLLASEYRKPYERVFGAIPVLGSLPEAASPLGSAAEREAWGRMSEHSRQQVNRMFANLGKAIAAYERTITYQPSRFDRYAAAVAAGDPAGLHELSEREVRGLKLFLGKGQCSTCHNGALLTDHAFHNTGVPSRNSAPDEGRAIGMGKLLRDEFNCLGPYSDAMPQQCGELQFLAENDSSQIGAFRTPSLRNVALRAPYMHAGQFSTLEKAVRHYMHAPPAAVGRSEITARSGRTRDRIVIRLSEVDVQDLVAFLGTLSGPVTTAAQ